MVRVTGERTQGVFKKKYIYIYIYREREREREGDRDRNYIGDM